MASRAGQVTVRTGRGAATDPTSRSRIDPAVFLTSPEQTGRRVVVEHHHSSQAGGHRNMLKAFVDRPHRPRVCQPTTGSGSPAEAVDRVGTTAARVVARAWLLIGSSW